VLLLFTNVSVVYHAVHEVLVEREINAELAQFGFSGAGLELGGLVLEIPILFGLLWLTFVVWRAFRES